MRCNLLCYNVAARRLELDVAKESGRMLYQPRRTRREVMVDMVRSDLG